MPCRSCALPACLYGVMFHSFFLLLSLVGFILLTPGSASNIPWLIFKSFCILRTLLHRVQPKWPQVSFFLHKEGLDTGWIQSQRAHWEHYGGTWQTCQSQVKRIRPGVIFKLDIATQQYKTLWEIERCLNDMTLSRISYTLLASITCLVLAIYKKKIDEKKNWWTTKGNPLSSESTADCFFRLCSRWHAIELDLNNSRLDIWLLLKAICYCLIYLTNEWLCLLLRSFLFFLKNCKTLPLTARSPSPAAMINPSHLSHLTLLCVWFMSLTEDWTKGHHWPQQRGTWEETGRKKKSREKVLNSETFQVCFVILVRQISARCAPIRGYWHCNAHLKEHKHTHTLPTEISFLQTGTFHSLVWTLYTFGDETHQSDSLTSDWLCGWLNEIVEKEIGAGAKQSLFLFDVRFVKPIVKCTLGLARKGGRSNYHFCEKGWESEHKEHWSTVKILLWFALWSIHFTL